MYLQPLDPQTIQKIQSRLEELGVQAPADFVAVVAAATAEWATKTNAGKEWLVSQFGFDWEAGASDVMYEDAARRQVYRGDQIYFLRTAVANGEFVPPSQIDCVKVDKEGCEDCGALVHCAVELPGGHRVCNYCAASSGDTSRRDLSKGMKHCEQCTVQGCQHYPHKQYGQVYRLA